ncbi:1-acylglycerol-3-phosphate O-acyltransferase [Snodgrassella sp. CFCC 13594]|uniref:1-acylglycerol-3-phosphate O-acyltransferase n=1 Tax=Snodgrassella sp. CFCC 13594 TaxID=1775559 RepID=UPI000834036F|nr:1-acylglycerol-3-phosphate O-acyltransferase [Snodgrassella sp. CFCC 13594]
MQKRPYTSLTTRFWRLIRMAAWLWSTTWIVYGFKKRNKIERDHALTGIAERMLRILNIQLHINQHAQCPSNGPILAVANHVSWLDIFVLMSQYPSGFIAKESIRRWPLIGTLATHVGTVFINRRSHRDVDTVNRAIADALAHQRSVTFFPEARTSNGLETLPFKAALFQAAIDTGAPVQAIALRYYYPQGTRTADVAYVGQTPLLITLWRILKLPEIHVNVDYAPLVGGEITRHADRFQLKDAAEHFIGSKVNQRD